MRIQGRAREALNRLLEQVRIYSRDPEAVERAADFLLFKLWAAEHAREEIIRTIQGGVTRMQYMPESLESGSPVGPIRVETLELAALNLLRLWMDTYLVELVGTPDALAQLANAAFDLGIPIEDTSLLHNVQSQLRSYLGTLRVDRPTGLEDWHRRATPWLDDLRELRNQATHRHLVRLIEKKAWEQQPPPPGPGKWTSDFVVDVRPGHSPPLIDLVALNYDQVLNLVRSSFDLLHVVLELVLDHRGGPKAAAKRRVWWAKGGGHFGHATVEPSDLIDREQDEKGFLRDIYFCSSCGERVVDNMGRRTPEGGTWWA